MTTAAESSASLSELARLYGVDASYEDGLGVRREADTGTLVAVLQSLGAPIDSPDDAPAAILARRESLSACAMEPVIVAWDGSAVINLRGPACGPIDCSLALEDGTVYEWQADAADADQPIQVPHTLPYGYHTLRIEIGGARHEAMLISAPNTAYRPSTADRDWGVFAPLYAIQSAGSWGTGDFADLRDLLDWTASFGGTIVATLPLLAAFTGKPSSVSPYSPASRLFWNEMYIHVPAVPEVSRSDEARKIVASPAFQADLESLRSSPLVDYEDVTALKRSVLWPLSQSIAKGATTRRDAFESFLAGNSVAGDYARFRAACEGFRAGWHEWPARQRGGLLQEGDLDSDIALYHAYVQWIAGEQLQSLSGEAEAKGWRLYLDMPLGVSADSYDTWRERDSFADGATVGAPPDAHFTGGQNWGFPAPHPQRARENGYRYLVASLRHVMRHASVLRIDHVLGLHRLFWIPNGVDDGDGVYVRYPADELYAILVLESHRNRTILVGEDLGNVPPYVRPAMAQHGLLRSYVLQFEMASGSAPEPPGRSQVASLNTHDTPPFAAFWAEVPEARRRSALAGLATDEDLTAGDSPTAGEAQRAANCWLAKSEAASVLVSLEDLLQETEPQNVPGTSDSVRPNWRRKAQHSLEEIREMPMVAESLSAVASARLEGEAAA